jgi:hypothetical protein
MVQASVDGVGEMNELTDAIGMKVSLQIELQDERKNLLVCKEKDGVLKGIEENPVLIIVGRPDQQDHANTRKPTGDWIHGLGEENHML